MQYSLTRAAVSGLFGFLALIGAATPAHADNKAVEILIESSPDLSTFRDALISTGVIHELKEDQNYTVFAPTNAAFVQIDPREYPCFYSVQCRPEVAAILRNHIVPRKEHIADLSKWGGAGIPTMGTRELYAEEVFKGNYEIEGHTVLSEGEVSGSVLDRIDGVITDNKEMAQFHALRMPTLAANRIPDNPVPGGMPGEMAMPARAVVMPGTTVMVPMTILPRE